MSRLWSSGAGGPAHRGRLLRETVLVPERTIDSDVIVCADDADARKRVIGLANLIEGVRGVDGGGLQNARYVEDFTAMLLNINRIYGAHSTIKIVGI